MKALGFDDAGARQTESTAAAMLSGMIASGQLYSGWRWEKEKLAVGEYAINVEQKKFDFLGARLGIRHARIVAKPASGFGHRLQEHDQAFRRAGLLSCLRSGKLARAGLKSIVVMAVG